MLLIVVGVSIAVGVIGGFLVRTIGHSRIVQAGITGAIVGFALALSRRRARPQTG